MLNEIVQPLLDWYDNNRRDLPWRADKDPYHIWVSEIMLQQTRVEAVKPYYSRFLTALPNVQALADCPEDALLKLWEGLGYYSRVRNMQKAAVQIRDEYDGVFPSEYEKILKLSGIGSYTAGAIASIAFSQDVPAVDGNVMRIWARVTGCYEDILKESVKKKAAKELGEIMPAGRSGDFNQAFMDLGSMICLPRSEARCKICPLQKLCRAGRDGLTDMLPQRKKPKERRIEDVTVLIIQDGRKTALHKRPDKGLLAGLYEFPLLPGFKEEKDILLFLREKNLDPLQIGRAEDAKHIFSHVEWHMQGYIVRVAALDENKKEDYIFVDTKTAKKEYALPSAFAAYVKYMK